MNERIQLAAALGLVAAVTVACKGSGGAPSAGGTTSTTVSATATAAPPAGCAEISGPANGSIHASVAYASPFEPPKSKRSQSYQCGTSKAIAYFLEYASPEKVSSACAFFTGELWAAAAPTKESPDELLTKGTSVAIVSGDAIAEVSAKLEADGYTRFRASAGAAPSGDPVELTLGKEVDCSAASKDLLRAWCPVTSFRTSGFSAPARPTTYVGITAAVKTGVALKTALLGDVTVSALTFSGGKALLTSITPDNPGEKATLAATAAKVSSALKGDAPGPIAVGKDLASFLDGRVKELSAKGYAVDATAGKPASFTAASPSEIALVHGKVDAYVVLEHAKDGTWINVFPVRGYVP